MKLLDEAPLKAQDRASILEAVRLLHNRFPVDRVILYGSKARGSDDAESDIDLLVLTARKLDRAERSALTDALFDVQVAHGVVFSTLVVPTEEWEEGLCAVLPIHDEVERDGVRL